MLFFETLIRFSIVGALLMLALTVGLSQYRNWPGRFLVLLSLSLCAMMIGTMSPELGLSRDVRFIFRLGDVPNTILVWLFAKSLLDDQFKMTWRYWLMAAVFCIPIWIARFDVQGFFDIITGTHIVLLNVYALCLFIYLIIDILRGRIDDLIEPRRRLRVFFVFGLVLLTILSIASEFILIGDAYNLQVPFKMIVISALTVSAYLWILQVRPDHFAFNQTPQSTSELDNTEQTEPLTQREQALKEALDHQMQDENVWLNPTLNIVGLAGKLAVTEHRLRRFINKRLGYRNFSSYINDYRIDAIKEALDQLEKRDIPILTIALDHGFNSLPPFNRAFKLREGVTPSVYRARLRQPAETH